ncbi:MAG: selenocysteine-specific translation elongation factor [candidate division KSB1 bacterium]|nr:selenocysteine-specific translation elongation factor [candidate division KSB1 bacterium]
MQRHIIIGTAGHIDHGKSLLVQKLTGTDPDRLTEEKERGLTIDLGFAFLSDEIAMIDVPGHERFIKNMVAGTQTVDMALLVVAADDSIMPQTKEHFDILRLLDIKSGIVVMTKCDLVDEKRLKIVEHDIREMIKDSFLESSPIQPVSALTGQGIKALSELIHDSVRCLSRSHDPRPFWMPVDRSFSIKGHGTVVTGSVVSGSVNNGDTLELLPQQQRVRVRGIQVHGQSPLKSQAGDRTALNLAQIDYKDIRRGDIASAPGEAVPASNMYARLTLLPGAPALEQNQRLRIHLGTAEIIGRIRILNMQRCTGGESCYGRLRLEKETAVRMGDRFILRRYSPLNTLGGGKILDPAAGLWMKKTNLIDHLKCLDSGAPETMLSSLLIHAYKVPVTFDTLVRLSGLLPDIIEQTLSGLIQQNKVIKVKDNQYIHQSTFDILLKRVLDRIKTFHRTYPHLSGVKRADIQANIFPDQSDLFNTVIQTLKNRGKIISAGQVLKQSRHSAHLSDTEQKQADQIIKLLKQHPYRTPPEKIIAKELNLSIQHVSKLLNSLRTSGHIIKLEQGIYMHREAVDAARKNIMEKLDKQNTLSVSEFRDMIGSSRKYALALLLHFDQTDVTERSGDVRILKK